MNEISGYAKNVSLFPMYMKPLNICSLYKEKINDFLLKREK